MTELKSGKFALVLPGQAATVSAEGAGGLSLNGSGTLKPIQQGSPRSALVNAAAVPKEGVREDAPASALPGPSNTRVASVATETRWTYTSTSASKTDGSWTSYFGSIEGTSPTPEPIGAPRRTQRFLLSSPAARASSLPSSLPLSGAEKLRKP